MSNGVPREEMGENSGQAILEEIIAENFPELKRDIYPQIERALKEFRVWLSTVYWLGGGTGSLGTCWKYSVSWLGISNLDICVCKN